MMTVGSMNRVDLWLMLKDSIGFLTVEDKGLGGEQVVYALVPMPEGIDPARCREVAEVVARALTVEPVVGPGETGGD